MNALLEKRVFAVAEGGDPQLVTAWERHNADALIELACAVPADRPFRAHEINLQLDQVRLALVHGTAHTVERDQQMVVERPADAVAVYVALSGEALVEYNGRRRVVRPGQLLLCDIDRPFLRGFGHGLRELAVRIPRSTLSAVAGVATMEEPLIVDTRRNQYARALARTVGRAVSTPVPVPVDELAVVDLVAVVATQGRAAPSTCHRAAARVYIDDHLADPDLAAPDVARGAGVSERHLSRLFAEAGTSVPRQVLARRLDVAYGLLRHGAADRTADVAVRCGFTSTAYFSQTFRRRFGLTAGRVLRLARASDGLRTSLVAEESPHGGSAFCADTPSLTTREI